MITTAFHRIFYVLCLLRNILQFPHILQCIEMSEIIAKQEKRWRYLLILHVMCGNYFTFKCLSKLNVTWVFLFTNCIEIFLFQTFDLDLNIFYLIHLFCIVWFFLIIFFLTFAYIRDCLVFPKHWATFKNTYLLKCCFYCINIFCIEFTFW